ncbi:MAG: LLM class flavin-dependent oxidoreductase [Flavobacteriaceae bacterium]|nr:LLM class flavin-dependent oxidoreductase [Flavobacteriaceae bacterium]
MKINQTPISILDLSLVSEGSDYADAIRESVAYIQFAEKIGIKRFWLAEHHNADGIASSATAVLIGHLAEKTQKIRVGSGGIMLPNHSPLQVAEAFGTLETMYPGRIDLGVGRAPGTDQLTSYALRRSREGTVEDYPKDIMEILRYVDDFDPQNKVNAFPGVGTHIPMWILGSSPYSAQLAAYLGLPYSFASHFAPQYLEYAMNLYRDEFKPSRYLDQPYFMPAANIVVAESQKEAEFQSTSYLQMAANIVQRKSGKIQKPVENMEALWSPPIKEAVKQMRTYSFVGTAEVVHHQLADFINFTQADEIMLTSYFFESKNREKSFEMLNDFDNQLNFNP